MKFVGINNVFMENASDNLTYCQCDSGWSGKSCNIKSNCQC